MFLSDHIGITKQVYIHRDSSLVAREVFERKCSRYSFCDGVTFSNIRS